MKDFIVSDRENYRSTVFCYDKDKELYVQDWGFHKTEPKHSCGPTIRPYYLIHLVESGKGYLEYNGTVTEVKAGEAFIIRPWEINLYRADEKEPWTYYWISFYGTLADKLMKDYSKCQTVGFSASSLVTLTSAVNNKINIDKTGSLYVLLTILNGLKSHVANSEEDIFDLALKYIENNYLSIDNISEVASVLGFSRTHFSTGFKHRFGKTPYNYLIMVRISRAKEYLSDSQLTITEIAYSVGFSSLERFSEMFIKYEGITPTLYRKRLKNEQL